MVYITRGLLEALLELAADRDPASVTVAMTVTDADALDVDLPSGSRVFTDMYLPDTGGSVSAVFGMDLSTPGAAGRFVSHPDGQRRLTRTDDLHQVVFVAVPPYGFDDVAAFDRHGGRVGVRTLDVEPPPGDLDDHPA